MVCRTNTDFLPPDAAVLLGRAMLRESMAISVSAKLKADIRRLVKAIESLREIDPASAREVERLIRGGFARRRRRAPGR